MSVAEIFVEGGGGEPTKGPHEEKSFVQLYIVILKSLGHDLYIYHSFNNVSYNNY